MDNNDKKSKITMPKVSSSSVKLSQNLPDGQHDEILELLRANLEISQKLLKVTKKFQRYLVFQKTWIIVKVLIIAVPLILGAIYLPPLLQGVIGQYQSLFNLNSATGSVNTNAIKGLIKPYAN